MIDRRWSSSPEAGFRRAAPRRTGRQLPGCPLDRQIGRKGHPRKGDQANVTVFFKNVGQKKLKVKFAALTVLG